MRDVTVQGVEMTPDAAENVRECAVDVGADVARLVADPSQRDALLAECLDGADPDREAGWRDYLYAVTREVERVAAMPERKPKTCDTCEAEGCDWRDDDYNTDGDCLAEK